MAQTGYTPISIYYSATATNTPTAGNLVAGELAINTNDGILYYKDSSGAVQKLATKGGVGTSSTTQVLYNNSGSLAGSANMTFNGTALTLANDASISGLTVGKGGGSDTASTTVGYLSLGAGATNTGTNNTSVGYGSMYVNTSGGSNVAFGGGALRYNTTGGSNSAIGFQALNSNTTASNNTAVGIYAGTNTTTGTQNNYFGQNSGYWITTGQQNAAYGVASQQATNGNGAASYNTAMGNYALQNNGANNNTAVGYQAGYSTTTGINNFYAGYQAGYTATTTGGNVAIGYQAGYNNQTNAGVFIGPNAGKANTTGTANTFVGGSGASFTGYANTTGSNNTAIGSDALQGNTTADNNTAVGYQAGYNNTTGAQNTLIGRLAGAGITTGYSNTIVGNAAANDTGPLTTGIKNVIIGAYSDVSSVNGDTQIVLGYDVTSAGNSTVTLGANTGKVYNAFTVNATWTQTSDGRLKTNITPDNLGLSFINRLNPVTFTWKPSNELEKDNPYYAEENERNTTTVIHGLIAQEVKEAMEAEGCTTFNGWDEGEDGIQAISREMFITPLIKAIQELKAEFDAYKATHP